METIDGQLRDIRTIDTLVVAETFASFAFTYQRLPAWSARDHASTSHPFAIDFAFTAAPGSVIERPGRATETRSVPPLAGGAVGAEPFDWVRTRTASEIVELRPSEALRAEVADTYRRSAADTYAETFGHTDPFLIYLALRLRAHALGGAAVSDLEGDALARLAVENTIEREGVPRPRGTGAKLDAARMERTRAFIEAHLHETLTLARLADVAAVSRHHFAVMFRRTVGTTPHAYVTALRMQRARQRLHEGAGVERAARAVGYRPAHQFRTAFMRTFGARPGAFAQPPERRTKAP